MIINKLKKKIISLWQGHAVSGLFKPSNKELIQDYPDQHLVIMNNPKPENIDYQFNIAVHLHMFYEDLAVELFSYLVNFPVPYHLYITTNTKQKAEVVRSVFSTLPQIEQPDIRITPNRGRDILPMICELGNELVEYDLVLHIHTKRSPHNNWILGGWRRYLYQCLMGDADIIRDILYLFSKDPNLGLLFPDTFHPVKRIMRQGSFDNDFNLEKILMRAKKSPGEMETIDRTYFPAGDMFWFRGEAIRPIVEMKLTTDDFEPEEGQLDQTLAHAFERIFPYFAHSKGYTSRMFRSGRLHCSDQSVFQFHILRNYLAQGILKKPFLLFDHDFGGGAGTFSRHWTENIVDSGGMVLRVFYTGKTWFIHWIAPADGMYFCVKEISELLNILSSREISGVVINSLYDSPGIKKLVKGIIKLVRMTRTPLEIMMSDYYPVCVSPRLIDHKNKYCGVPDDFRICRECLLKNNNKHTHWSSKSLHEISIKRWRKLFNTLFNSADILTFFHQSTLDVYQKALTMNPDKVRIIPVVPNPLPLLYNLDFNAPMHIGILGSLTMRNGGNIVNELGNYISTQGLRISMTVVGPGFGEMHSLVKVLGPYEQYQLPSIIEKNSINVILSPEIVPQIFGYTVSEAIMMGLPIVAFNTGVQGSLLKNYQLGETVPLSASMEVIITALQSVLQRGRTDKNQFNSD